MAPTFHNFFDDFVNAVHNFRLWTWVPPPDSERNNYRNMWNRFGPILLRRSLNRLIWWWRWCLRFRWCLWSVFQDLFRFDHLLVLFIRARCVRVDLLELVADLCLVIFSSRKECEIGWFGNLEWFTRRVLRDLTYFQVLAVFWRLVIVDLSEKSRIVKNSLKDVFRDSNICGRRWLKFIRMSVQGDVF